VRREAEFAPGFFGRERLAIGWLAVELGKRCELVRLWLDLLGEQRKKLRDVASGGRGYDVRRDLYGPAHRQSRDYRVGRTPHVGFRTALPQGLE
jgi:hypothetical protein